MATTTDSAKTREGKIIISARLRPFSRGEEEAQVKNIIEMSDNTLTVLSPDESSTKEFKFDFCHWSHDGYTLDEDGVRKPSDADSRYAGQKEVFADIGMASMAKVWEGYNIGVLSYGVTGSGKSFTMLGNGPEQGLVHLFSQHLFSSISGSSSQAKCKVTLSMLELYNEFLLDLLTIRQGPKGGLRIRERKDVGPYVENLTEVSVKNAAQVEQLLNQGIRSRTVAAHRMNSVSSRSHLIIALHLKQFFTNNDGSKVNRTSRIRFLDMAGSERVTKTGATGHQLQEGAAINKSVSALGAVIMSLAAEKKSFTPYRNSKLTRILKDELGGNCCTFMIAAISPAEHLYDETLSTLRFVSRAAAVNQKAVVNDILIDDTLRDLRKQIMEFEDSLKDTTDEDAVRELKKNIESVSFEMEQLELAWKEKDAKDTGATWWSVSVKVERPELETQPYLQNVAEDPQLSGVVKHSIPLGPNLLGKTDTDKVTIQLDGLGIIPWHAIVNNTGSTLHITPCSKKATIHVNGQQIFTPVALSHLDRVKFGAGELFVYIGFPSERSEGQSEVCSYDKFLTELAEKHPLAKKIQPPADCEPRVKTAAMVLFQEFTDLQLEVEQASAIALLFERDIEYTLKVKTERKAKQFYVQAAEKSADKKSEWSLQEFQGYKAVMDELFERWILHGEQPVLRKGRDPFVGTDNKETLIGRCLLQLHPLSYLLPVEETLPVLDLGKKQSGSLHVSIVPCNSQGNPVTPGEVKLQDPKELLGKTVSLLVAITDYQGILWAAVNPGRGVYCKFCMHGQSRPVVTEMKYGRAMGRFEDKFKFSFESVDEAFVEFLQSEGLRLEIWGVQAQEDCAAQPAEIPQQTSAPLTPSSQTEEHQQKKTSPDAESQQLPQGSSQNPAGTEELPSVGDKSSGYPAKFDGEMAQNLEKVHGDLRPVMEQLTELKHQALRQSGESDQDKDEAWTEFARSLQTAEERLNQSVLTLQEMVMHMQNQHQAAGTGADGKQTELEGSVARSKACTLQ